MTPHLAPGAIAAGSSERLLENLSCLSVGRRQEMGVDPERGRSPTGVADPTRHRTQVDPAGDELGGRVVADRAALSGGRAVWPAARTGASPSPGAWAAGQPGQRRTHRHRRRAARRRPPPARHSGADAPPAAPRCPRRAPAGERRGSWCPSPPSGRRPGTGCAGSELGRLQFDAPPPQRAQLPAPGARRRGQPQQDREVRVSLVGGLQEPGDLLWGGRSDLQPSRVVAGWPGPPGSAGIQPQRAA